MRFFATCVLAATVLLLGVSRPLGATREYFIAAGIFDQDRGRERGLCAINGYIFGNLPGLVMAEGDRSALVSARWGTRSISTRPLAWASRAPRPAEHRRDRAPAGSMATADMLADNPGTWMIHCHVADHIAAGMLGRYTISPRDGRREAPQDGPHE
jgi:hypothetical protein